MHFKHAHTRYPKTLLLAYWVQRYARLGRQIKDPPFVALCIPNTRILDIQKNCCILGAELCAFGVLNQNPTFFRHCAIQTHQSYVSKNTFAGMFGAEVCALEAPRQNPTFFGMEHIKHPHPKYQKNTFVGRLGADVCPRFFGIVHFKHTDPRYPKTLLLAYLVHRYARLERRAKTQKKLSPLCPDSCGWLTQPGVWGSTGQFSGFSPNISPSFGHIFRFLA